MNGERQVIRLMDMDAYGSLKFIFTTFFCTEYFYVNNL